MKRLGVYRIPRESVLDLVTGKAKLLNVPNDATHRLPFYNHKTEYWLGKVECMRIRLNRTGDVIAADNHDRTWPHKGLLDAQ